MAGSWLGGRLVDRVGVRRVLLVGSSVAAVAFAALPWAGRSMPGALAYAVVTPLAGWAVSVALPHRLASLDPANAQLLISLNSSALYLGTAAGGAVGSAAIALFGGRWFPLAAAGLALVAAATARAATRGTASGVVSGTASGRPGAVGVPAASARP